MALDVDLDVWSRSHSPRLSALAFSSHIWNLAKLSAAIASAHLQMFVRGQFVTVTGLQSRAELNGCAGHVLGTATDGRLPIRVFSAEGGDVLCEVRVRLQNLAPRELEAYGQVLESTALLGEILIHIARWEQSGRASGVSKLWRHTVLCRPQHWQHIVLVPEGQHKPSAREMAGKLQRLPTSSNYDVHRHLHSGALPVWPAELHLNLRFRLRCWPKDAEGEYVVPYSGENAEEVEDEEVEDEMDTKYDIHMNDENRDCKSIYAADWVKQLVVLGALVEQSWEGITESGSLGGDTERSCIDVYSTAAALNHCHNLRSLHLDFGDWQQRAFGSLVSPSFRPGGPVDRWLDKPPQSLEYVRLIGIDRFDIADFFSTKRFINRWRGIFDYKNLPRLRGFAPFDLSLAEVEAWPAERRAMLECVELQEVNAYELENFICFLRLLPALRRVRWICGGLEDESLARVVLAIHEHGVLESLFVQACAHARTCTPCMCVLSRGWHVHV